MPEYTALAVLSVVGTLAAERFWLRTGVLRTQRYWAAMAIVFAFQVAVDGWLTKLSAPIVRYDASQTTGLRFPWDIPVEDYLFGFSMVTLTILLWVRAGTAEHPSAKQTEAPGGTEQANPSSPVTSPRRRGGPR